MGKEPEKAEIGTSLKGRNEEEEEEEEEEEAGAFASYVVSIPMFN